MNIDEEYKNPEPVPPASQLIALPFLAGVEGFLRGLSGTDPLRVTLHRAMNREGQGYLQQVCEYVGTQSAETKPTAGRMFPVNFGIIGEAFGKRCISRTRAFATKELMRAALRQDMAQIGEVGDVDSMPLAWLAIPFLAADEAPVLILFADSYELNFFADNERLRTLIDMCRGFCRLLDALEKKPLPSLRNFPLRAGEMVKGVDTVYPSVQETVADIPSPRLNAVRSFNYDASVS